MDVTQAARVPFWKERLEKTLLAPIRAFRPSYLPLLMVYFAYGVGVPGIGIANVAETFWVRETLTLSAADLAGLAVWFGLPWTIKMVFGELVDTVPFLGSQRRSYVFAGAALAAAGYVLWAGNVGGWIGVASPNQAYVVGNLLIVIGLVLQDVVADAMSTEVVPRTNADGSPRPQADVDHDLGMVQVLGRLALLLGLFSVALLAGVLAQYLSYDKVFLVALIAPIISVSGAVLVRLETTERRPTDWRILGGGIAFGAVVAALGIAKIPLGAEIVFAFSLLVVVAMLARVTRTIDRSLRMRIAMAAIIIFAFRATPVAGDGWRWFEIDVLGFSPFFFGVLGQIGAAVAIISLWLWSDAVTRKPVAQVLVWLTVLGTVMSLPLLVLVFRWYDTIGISPQSIAVFETVATSPFLQLSMIPVLTLVAIYAPAGHRATWFALMASLMNLALQASALQTKYLNLIFQIDRGAYDNLPALIVTVLAVSLLLPLVAIAIFGRRIR
jgi:hypothetical protein